MLAAGSFRMQTERLELSPWGEDDIEGLRALATDPEVVRYISNGVPWPEERVREFFERQRRLYAERGYCMWRLSAGGGEAIGFCGIQPLAETGEIEIGWWLAKEYWGRGLATEAARCALSDAFERVGLHRVVAIAMEANRASTRIMEKLGMRYEKRMQHRGVEVVLYAVEGASP
jgi:RimJ/RimL family protein N-acetyltransferase